MNELERENASYFYIIEADRDGQRKYVNKSFPNIYQYTKKILHAKRFYSEERALEFIEDFNSVGRYMIENPTVKKVKRTFTVEWNSYKSKVLSAKLRWFYEWIWVYWRMGRS